MRRSDAWRPAIHMVYMVYMVRGERCGVRVRRMATVRVGAKARARRMAA